MYTELVEEHHWMLFFATYRMSQDHIEMMFAKIRTMNGNNDNPMAHQFISAYRKILHQCETTHSLYANVKALDGSSSTSLVTSGILTIPSTRNLRSRLQQDVQQQNDLLLRHSSESVMQESNDFLNWELLNEMDYLTDSTQNAGIVHMAQHIENKLKDCSQIYCEPCLQLLQHSAKVDSKMCINIERSLPCSSTYKICKVADLLLKQHIDSGSHIKQKIYMEVVNNHGWDNIFMEFDQYDHDIEHKHFLIKFVIDEYVNKKCAYIAKQTMLDVEKSYVRNRLRKLCHNYHQ